MKISNYSPVIKEYKISFITKSETLPDSNVPCGDCNRCCSLSPHLSSEEFESGKYIYTFLKIPNENHPVVAIPRNSLGCIYLINGKCSIYDDRPKSCRQFDCRQGHYLPLVEFAKEKFGDR